jgi:hypothetical protein
MFSAHKFRQLTNPKLVKFYFSILFNAPFF